MSTPSANGTSKPTPRMGGALTPSASTPSRNISSPAHHTSASSKTVGRSPWKNTPSTTAQTPLGNSLNVHTPTPSGALPSGSSPAVALDGLTGRARAGTTGIKSAAGSPAGQTPAAFSGLGLTLTPLVGGLNVSHQLNDTTILDTLGLVGRGAEAWTSQRLKEIVDLLGTRWGKVSQDNVKRCVDRIGGLECYWEDHPGGKEKIGERKRTLAIAGNEILLEISWLGVNVTRVRLTFMRGNEESTDDLGAEILRCDLVGTLPGYVEIKGFVENLSRLARIDQLGRGKVSCFEALEGLADSLKKLWDLELAKEQETTNIQAVAEIKAMCERSGRPRTHSETEIGLRLDYWIDQRLFEQHEVEQGVLSDASKHPYSLVIDCEAFGAAQYPSIRTSQAWLSASVIDAISDPTLPIWNDPPPTFVPGTQIPTASDALDLGIATGTQPDVRFIVRLKPAIILPLHAAVEILTHMEQPMTEESIGFTTYLSLLFPDIAGFSNRMQDGKVPLSRSVTSYNRSGDQAISNQRFEVFTQPSTWARTITELPFSHPRQLIDILPYLRQWAFFGQFLRRSFGDGAEYRLETQSSKTETTTMTAKSRVLAGASRAKLVNGYRHKYQHYEPPSDTDSEGDEPELRTSSAANMTVTKTQSGQAGAHLDVSAIDVITETSFTFSTIARRIDMAISMTFLNLEGGSCSCAVNLYIHPNATLEVENNLVFQGGHLAAKFATKSEAEAEKVRKRLERVLRVSEDVGALAAWLINATHDSGSE